MTDARIVKNTQTILLIAPREKLMSEEKIYAMILSYPKIKGTNKCNHGYKLTPVKNLT